MELADQGYNLTKPALPYLAKPYHTYLASYVSKADTLGDQGLSKVDTKFPLVKESTDKIKGVVYGTASLPLKVADEVKKHVLDTYGDEYKKIGGGGGLVASGKAAVSTGFILSQESLVWITSFLQAKKEAVKNSTAVEKSTTTTPEPPPAAAVPSSAGPAAATA